MTKKEKGFILVLTMLFIVFGLLFGSLLLKFSLIGFKSDIKKEEQMQAYYVARAGADTVAQAIINDKSRESCTTASGIIPLTVDSTGATGTFNVNINKDINTVTLDASGQVDDTTEDITLKLTKNPFGEATVFTKQDLYLEQNNAEIIGNVYMESNGTIHDGNNLLNGNYEDNLSRELDPVVIPEYDLNSDDPLESSSEIVIDMYDDETAFTNITANNSITFDTTNTDVLQIVVDSMTLHGTLSIEGNGIVEIYVRNDIDIQTKHSTTVGADSHNLIIYLNGDSSADPVCSISSNAEFYGYIYGPDANLRLNSGNSGTERTQFHGQMIVDEFYGTPNGFQGQVYDWCGEFDFEGLNYKRKVWMD